jgi:hypothetical protein
MEKENKNLIIYNSLPVIIALLFKIFFGVKWMIYGFVGTYCLELIVWGFKHSE